MAKDFAELNRLEHEAGIQAPEAGSKDELVNKFVKAWENEAARRAVKGGAGLTMALTLAACGGSSGGVVSTSGETDGGGDEPTTPVESLIALVDGGITTLTGTNPVVSVPNPTAGADALDTTIGGDGMGTLELRFEDADDTVTLAGASDLSGYDTLAITAGTVDVTGVDLSGITSITVSSGVVLSGTQFLALENGVTGGSDESTVELIIVDADQVTFIIAAIERLGGTLSSSNVTLTAAPDSELTEAELAEQQAALNAAFVESGIDEALPTALQALSVANAAVTAQEEAIAEFLEAAFANEFVEGAATDQDGSASDAVEADDVIGEDIAEANIAAAVVFEGDVAAADGAAFVALSEAQQVAQIGLARTNLEAAVDNAETALADAADALEVGVSDLLSEADTAATELEAALVALADAEEELANELVLANANVDVTDVDGVEVGTDGASVDAATYDEFQVTTSDGVTTLQLVDTADGGADAIDIATFDADATAGDQWSVADGFVLDEDAGTYSVVYAGADDAADATVDDETYTLTEARFDALIASLNAESTADAEKSSAEDALAEAVVDVFEGQGVDFGDGAPAFADLSPADGSTIISVDGSTVTLDYNPTDGDDVMVADGDAGIDGADTFEDALGAYVTALDSLSGDNGAEAALTAFDEAVANWQETSQLVADYDALVEELGSDGDLADAGTLEAAVTAAEAAITNATDAETDPGLGLNLEAFTDGATATELNDVYVFESDPNAAVTIGDFGTEGVDRLYFGEEYTFVEMAEDAAIGDTLGDVAVLEIFAEETDTGVTLYVEDIASAGTGSGTTDVTQVDLTGATLADITFAADTGILSADTAAIA